MYKWKTLRHAYSQYSVSNKNKCGKRGFGVMRGSEKRRGSAMQLSAAATCRYVTRHVLALERIEVTRCDSAVDPRRTGNKNPASRKKEKTASPRRSREKKGTRNRLIFIFSNSGAARNFSANSRRCGSSKTSVYSLENMGNLNFFGSRKTGEFSWNFI